jgi:hypothetical protein
LQSGVKVVRSVPTHSWQSALTAVRTRNEECRAACRQRTSRSCPGEGRLLADDSLLEAMVPVAFSNDMTFLLAHALEVRQPSLVATGWWSVF